MNIYVARTAILRALLAQRHQLTGTILDVGCGEKPYQSLLMKSAGGAAEKYIGLDLENNPTHNNKPDLLWDGNMIPLNDKSVDSVLLTEVMEHVPQPAKLLSEINRVLADHGKVFGTVPFLFPLHEVPYDYYRYTPFAIDLLAQKAGFRVESIQALGGWDASLAQMIGLWVMQSPMRRIYRACLILLLYPPFLWLLRRDQTTARPSFLSGPMITGVWFILKKQSALANLSE